MSTAPGQQRDNRDYPQFFLFPSLKSMVSTRKVTRIFLSGIYAPCLLNEWQNGDQPVSACSGMSFSNFPGSRTAIVAGSYIANSVRPCPVCLLYVYGKLNGPHYRWRICIRHSPARSAKPALHFICICFRLRLEDVFCTCFLPLSCILYSVFAFNLEL